MKSGLGGVITRIVKWEQNNSQAKSHLTKSLKKIHHDENARELLDLVRTRIDIRKGYLRLGVLAIFLITYVVTVLSQQNVAGSFSVESR